MCNLDKKCGPCALKEKALKEDRPAFGGGPGKGRTYKIGSQTPPVQMQRQAGVKYKDPYFVNLVWTTVNESPNISSSQLWNEILHTGKSHEYLGDTRTFQKLMGWMRQKGYLKRGTPQGQYRTAWVVGNKPAYSVVPELNIGHLKEDIQPLECEKCGSTRLIPYENGLRKCKDCGYLWMPTDSLEQKSLVESILHENEIDIERYADVVEYFENGLGLLKGIKMTDLSPTAFDSLSKLQHIIKKLGQELGNNSEMRDN